jgi:hypothetical protein
MDKSNLDMNKLADKAWGSMSQILDREMPQKKDRKRFILLFFLLSTVLVAASFLLYRSLTNNDDSQNHNEPIALNDLKTKPVFESNQTAVNYDHVEEDRSDLAFIDESLESVTKDITISILDEEAKTKYDTDPIIESVSFDKINKRTKETLPTDIQNVEKKNLREPKNTTETNNNFIGIVNQISALARLDCGLFNNRRSLMPAKYVEVELEEIITDEKEKSRLKSLLGLSLSLTTDGFFTGYGGGYDLQVSLPKRLFVLGGVSFHSYKAKDQASPSFSISNNEAGAFEDGELPENEGTTMDENVASNVESIRSNLNFNNFNALDFHIGVGVKLTNNLGFWLGGNLKQVFSIEQPDFEPVLAAGAEGSSLNSSSLFINPKVGVYYDVIDRLRVAINFERGFKHLYYDTNNIVEFDPLSFTNLKMAYSF